MPSRFFPSTNAGDPQVFRSGARGTHSSRTAMIAELAAFLDAGGDDDPRDLIVEHNVLGKPTASGRASAFQRLRELYLLNPKSAAFRLLRALWRIDRTALPQLALLLALARDPLLRLSAPTILSMRAGEQLSRVNLVEAIQKGSAGRLNEAVADKVARNAASTWTQVGHLEGRTFKTRRKLTPALVSGLYGLWLAKRAGFAGADLFSSGWMSALDLTPATARGLAERGRAAGHIQLRIAAEVVDVDLAPLERLG